jgi:hypothetical protein
MAIRVTVASIRTFIAKPLQEMHMHTNAAEIFSDEWAGKVFPPERTDAFFAALFGGAEEGAYDISLRFVEARGDAYTFAFDLRRREGKCLVCSLTYGLPQVFARHPVLDVKGVAQAVALALGKDPAAVRWEMKPTREESGSLHWIPFVVNV